MNKIQKLFPSTTNFIGTPIEISSWVAAALLDLQTETQVLVDDYWARLKDGRKIRKLNEQGSIGLRSRPRDTGGFSIEWYEMGVIKPGGLTKFVAKKQYAKGRGFRYSLEKPLAKQPDWVSDLVRELEDEFERIRKRQAMLIKIRDCLITYHIETTGERTSASKFIAQGSQYLKTAGERDENN